MTEDLKSIREAASRMIVATTGLLFEAMTTGGTAGRDDDLVAAIDKAAKARDAMEEALRLFDKMVSEEPVAWMLAYMPSSGEKHWQLRWTRDWKDRLPGAENERALYLSPFAQPKVSDSGHDWQQRDESAYECKRCGADSEGLPSPCIEHKAEGMVTVRAEDAKIAVSALREWGRVMARQNASPRVLYSHADRIAQALKDQS